MQPHMPNQQVMLALIRYQPLAAVLLLQPTRFERMAQELSYALLHTSGSDMTNLLAHLAKDGGSAVVRRVTGVVELTGKLLTGTVSELEGVFHAYAADRLAQHIGTRIGIASAITTNAVSNGAKSFASLVNEIRTNPTDAAPKLLVLVLTSVIASGGVDGNGGMPDLDIPLMGIGEHRSPLTHSILIGSLLETALLLLMRIVLCTHKNLPEQHDPLWEGLVHQSVGILRSAGKGASIGIAYHLMVDAVVQPGAYHGMPFDMPLEAHQTIFAANSVAEGLSAKTYPDEESLTATPDVLAAHQKFRAIEMRIPHVLCEYLKDSDVEILRKYGAWLQALAKRDISVSTIEQVRFLKVADGVLPPESNYENAWTALANAKRQAGWIT